MQPHSFSIPTEKKMIGKRPHDCISLGPLFVNFGRVQGGLDGWIVTHEATKGAIGEPWDTCQGAIAAAGALLGLPIDWNLDAPIGNRGPLVAAALARVREAMAYRETPGTEMLR